MAINGNRKLKKSYLVTVYKKIIIKKIGKKFKE
jgi:hypothetical protein